MLPVKPDFVTEDQLLSLDGLHEGYSHHEKYSLSTQAVIISDDFDCSISKARRIVSYWISTLISPRTK